MIIQLRADITFLFHHVVETIRATRQLIAFRNLISHRNSVVLDKVVPLTSAYLRASRSRGDIADFVEKPTVHNIESTTKELRHIHDLASNLPEGDFAWVELLENEYWITRSIDIDEVLLQKVYVLIDMEHIATTDSMNQ